MSLTAEAQHENEDPILFPPLIHDIRQAEIQAERAQLLCKLASTEASLAAEDKAEILNSLQSARGNLAEAKRALAQFLKQIGERKAHNYISLSKRLQASKKRSLIIRRWIAEGVLVPGDACYENITKRSADFVSKASKAASLLAVMEQEAKGKPAPEAPQQKAEQ